MPPPKNATLSNLNHKLSINDFQKQILQLPRHGQNLSKSPSKKAGHKTPEEKRRKKTSSSDKNKLVGCDENAPPGNREKSREFFNVIPPPEAVQSGFDKFEHYGSEDDSPPPRRDNSLNKDVVHVIIPPESESNYNEPDAYGYEDGKGIYYSDGLKTAPEPLTKVLTPAEQAMVKRMMEIQKQSFTAPRLPIPRIPTPPTAPPFNPVHSFSAPRPRKQINSNQLDKLMYKNAPGYINPANPYLQSYKVPPVKAQSPLIRTPWPPIQQYSALPGMSNYNQRWKYPDDGKFKMTSDNYPEDGKFKMTSDSLPPPSPPPPLPPRSPSQYPNQNEVKFITNILLDKTIEEPSIGPQLPHSFIQPQPSPGYNQPQPSPGYNQPQPSPGYKQSQPQLRSNYQPAAPQQSYNNPQQASLQNHYTEPTSALKPPYYPPVTSQPPSNFQPFSNQQPSSFQPFSRQQPSSFKPISPKNPKSLASFKLPSEKPYDFSALSDCSESDLDKSLNESNDSFTVPTFSQLNSPNWSRQVRRGNPHYSPTSRRGRSLNSHDSPISHTQRTVTSNHPLTISHHPITSHTEQGSRVQDGRWAGADRSSGQGSSNVNRKPRSSCSSPVTRDVRVSKMLSSVCRHNAEKFNLAVVDGGYLFVEEILNTEPFKNLTVTQDEILQLVKSNDKQRFSVRQNEGHWQICANQGHSMAVTGLSLVPITDVSEAPIVIHGTYKEVLPVIEQQGLSKMNRTHIHFASGLPQDQQVVSGMRGDCEVYIYIDLAKALHDGYKFFKSVNNVILCSGNEHGYLPPFYFSKVVTNNRPTNNRTSSRLSEADLCQNWRTR